MKFVVWGARGSIAAPGPETVRYGGDTTCAQIVTGDGEHVVLDMGTGLRRLGNHYADLEHHVRSFHLLLTHAHWDHLMGLPFFRPLYQPGNRLVFHGCSFANDSIRDIFRQTMKAPFFPVDFDEVAADIVYDEACIDPFSIGSLGVERIRMNHPNGGCGLRFVEGGRSLVFFPDNELAFPHPGGPTREEFLVAFRGTDLLVHDAMYEDDEYENMTRGWGHSRWREVIDLALEADVKALLLWHHDPDRDDEAIDEILRRARERVAESGKELAVDAARPGWSIEW